jgi:hypothetical protein
VKGAVPMCVPVEFGYNCGVKTTVELADALFARAKKHAQRTGQPMRALIEEGLRLVLDQRAAGTHYELSDRTVGNARGKNPLEALSWQELREEIYGGR